MTTRYRSSVVESPSLAHSRLVEMTAADAAALREAIKWLQEAWCFASGVGLVDLYGGTEQRRMLPVERIAAIVDRYDDGVSVEHEGLGRITDPRSAYLTGIAEGTKLGWGAACDHLGGKVDPF